MDEKYIQLEKFVTFLKSHLNKAKTHGEGVLDEQARIRFSNAGLVREHHSARSEFLVLLARVTELESVGFALRILDTELAEVVRE